MTGGVVNIEKKTKHQKKGRKKKTQKKERSGEVWAVNVKRKEYSRGLFRWDWGEKWGWMGWFCYDSLLVGDCLMGMIWDDVH